MRSDADFTTLAEKPEARKSPGMKGAIKESEEIIADTELDMVTLKAAPIMLSWDRQSSALRSQLTVVFL